MRLLLLAALAVLLPAAEAVAQATKVTAAFDRLELRPDDIAVYTITISGGELPRLRRDPTPDFSAFDVVSGPSRGSSTQVNIVNGRAQMNESLKLSWQLIPKGGREGDLSVPGFPLVLGTETLRVPETRVKSTLEAASGRSGRSRGGLDPFDRGRRGGSSGLEEAHLEVRARVPDRRIYVGEELVLSHVLEFGPGAVVRTFDPEPAEFAGFEKQQRKVKHEARRVPGESWQEVPLAQWRLVPLTVGEKELPAQGYVLHVQPSSRDPFDGFFNTGEQRLRRATRPVAIDVAPLPAGAPRDFGGAVGTFQLDTKLGAAELAQGDGTTLTVTIRGTGNFSRVKPPQLQLPPGVRAFDPEVRDDTRAGRDGRTTGAKIYEFPLLVETAGEHRFEGLSWSYFDPKSERFVTRRAKAARLVATPSERPAPAALAGGPRTSVVETLDTDIHHLMGSWTPAAAGAEPGPGLPAWFWPALLAGPLLPLLGLGWGLSRRLGDRDARSTRSKQAAKEARKRLAEAEAAVAAGKVPDAADAAAAAVSRFVVERCGVGGAEPVAAEVVELVERHAGPELAGRVSSHLADCDFLRFAGSRASASEARARAAEAKSLLASLERELSLPAGGAS